MTEQEQQLEENIQDLLSGYEDSLREYLLPIERDKVREKVTNDLMQILLEKVAAAKEETAEKIIKIIEGYIPTDDMGDYGGSGAMSDEEICEMFIDEMIPEIREQVSQGKENNLESTGGSNDEMRKR
jgi:hypothetical protein